jgi:hypothetical protein
MGWRRKIGRHVWMVEMESDDKEKNIVPKTPYLESVLMDEEEENIEPITLRT